MHRSALVAMALASSLLLAGCGDSTITVRISAGGQNASVVVTSDATAIAALRATIASTVSASSGETVLDGDQHSGNQVCTFTRSKNGHSYTVTTYGQVPATSCNTSAQQSFLTDAP